MKRATTKTETEKAAQSRVTSNSVENKKFNEMKTTNNVQKAILKSLAVIVSLVLITFTVSAQGFWESLLENTSFKEIALAMTESTYETNQPTSDANSNADMDAFASLFVEEIEESLEMENWMTNEANFTSSFTIEEELENTMELEEWMTNSTSFRTASINLDVEAEETLEVENWMLDTENFDTDVDYTFITIDDYELKLEPWMTDNKVWNN